MKRLFNYSHHSEFLNIGILFARVASGSFILTHGLPKLEKLMAGGDVQFADPMGMGMYTSLVIAVVTEVVFAFMLIFGLATRLALFGLTATLAVAAFIVHSGDPFKTKELALMYFLMFGLLFVIGAGKYSLDYLIYRKMK